MPLVLIIDDDPDLRDILALMLGASGFQVATAADGREGLALMAAERPDAVLCDIDMPRLDGEAVARAMRGNAVLRTIPLILMSGRVPGSQPMPFPADAMLAKPFSSKLLLAHLQRLLAPPQRRISTA